MQTLSEAHVDGLAIGGRIYDACMRPYHEYDLSTFNLYVATTLVVYARMPYTWWAYSSPRCRCFLSTSLLIHSHDDLIPTHPTSSHPIAFFFEKGAGALLIQLHHLPFYSTVCSVPFLCTHLNPCLSLAPFCSLLLVTFRLKNEYTCIWPRL
jgi:hypothetical protein